MKKIVTTSLALSLILVAHTCNRFRDGAESTSGRRPVIEIAPLEQGGGQWKIAASDTVTATVTAPGVERVQILGRPVGVEEDYLDLRTLTAPVDRESGKFVTRLNLDPDFAGQVWAEIVYHDGSKKRTETIALAVDKEVSAYHIGIGQKYFPVPIGEREVKTIIFNPSWVPADGAWASCGKGVSPDERIRSNDPRPLLSKIKIPLGSGYLSHDASKADDIGHAVSQRCILMLRGDLIDLAEKILTARDPSVAKSRINQLMGGYEKFAASLDPPVLVDVNYDLHVVEGGVLHVYPDFYERGAFALDSLRAELQSARVAAPLLGDQSLRWMLDQIGVYTQFVINVADIRKWRLRRGLRLPSIDRPIENKREITLARGDGRLVTR
jgi:hypothetical protein